MYREVSRCRVCGNTALVPVLALGLRCLTGVFRKSREQITQSTPFELVERIDSAHDGPIRQDRDVEEADRRALAEYRTQPRESQHWVQMELGAVLTKLSQAGS